MYLRHLVVNLPWVPRPQSCGWHVDKVSERKFGRFDSIHKKVLWTSMSQKLELFCCPCPISNESPACEGGSGEMSILKESARVGL